MLRLIRRTFELAEQARARGNHPFGALLAVDETILLEAENTVTDDSDCTRHAELNLISHAVRALPADTLAKAILYASTEPCPMCTGALYWSGIRKLVYGLPTEMLAVLAGGGLAVPCREILKQGSEKITVEGPLLETEAKRVHDGFWKS